MKIVVSGLLIIGITQRIKIEMKEGTLGVSLLGNM